MNILLVGGGGREHALAWKIAASPKLDRLVVAPGNPGIARIAETRAIAPTDTEALISLAREIAADLIVVGPESALEAGLADCSARAGIPCFGPTAQAARIETSKAFMKEFSVRHDIPTAACGVFETLSAARAYLRRGSPPFVVKADGLAAGKGVTIAATLEEAEGAAEACLSGGRRVVIEDFMQGEEVSVFTLSDGQSTLPFGAAQDHKRAFDGDTGPMTGGMGTFAPVGALTGEIAPVAEARIVTPALHGLAAERAPYRGVIFAGLMLTRDGPRLVEFNARFGDPECQILMLRLESDIVPYLLAAATGGLSTMPPPSWRPDAAVCVVLAAEGYPTAPKFGSEIVGADADFGRDVFVFHAGTARRADGALIASGGRTLNVCARGASVRAARERAYAAVRRIDWPGGFCRSDIGLRGVD